MTITKAIIPAAGLGTRFLPATKVVPKEMLNLLDKPIIQYSVEEGIKSGIKDFVIVTSRDKESIIDHFCENFELNHILKNKKKIDVLRGISKITSLANFISVRQNEPLGLGHAVWSARRAVENEYVAVMLPDDIMTGNNPGLSQLIDVALQEKCSVIAVQEVSEEEISNYGVIEVKKQFSPNLFQVKDLIEKPKPYEAPSCLAIVGRYVLSPEIFEILERTGTGSGGEIQLTNGIQNMLLAGEKVFAYKIKGERYDVGNPLGLLKASISLSLKNQKYSEEISEYLSMLEKDLIVMQGKSELLNNKRTKAGHIKV